LSGGNRKEKGNLDKVVVEYLSSSGHKPENVKDLNVYG
jgi:hypothetical protein